MSRLAKVKMHRDWACRGPHAPRRAYYAAPGGRASVFVVEPGEPGREPVHRRLELRRGIHELPQPLGKPAKADLLAAPPLGEFLDAPVGEVHALAQAQRAF